MSLESSVFTARELLPLKYLSEYVTKRWNILSKSILGYKEARRGRNWVIPNRQVHIRIENDMRRTWKPLCTRLRRKRFPTATYVSLPFVVLQFTIRIVRNTSRKIIMKMLLFWCTRGCRQQFRLWPNASSSTSSWTIFIKIKFSWQRIKLYYNILYYKK